MRITTLLQALALTATARAQCPYMDGRMKLDKRDGPEAQRLPGDDGFMEQFELEKGEGQYMTTDTGVRVDDRTSLKAGNRGPSLLEDFIVREKLTAFDHERIPERPVHARGAAAHGYFEAYDDFSNITAASPFIKKGKQTPVFLRFSTVAGSRGSPDTARDVHGFALKMYTDTGNYDIVGNSVAPFFIQDAAQFPDLVHAVKPEPNNEIPQAGTAHNTAWDFFSKNPSSLHTLMWVLSPHGTPRSFRHVNGHGVHTFRWVNEDGDSKLIRYHFRTKQGLASLTWEEAQSAAGQNLDFHRADMWDNIKDGNFPEWEVGVQIMNEEDVLKYGFDLLDPTKIVPEEYVPITPVGKLVLNRNPKNYFAETEQVMFCPSNIIRGIDFSDDPLLQGRLFSYKDAHLNRNGGNPNFQQIPINRARVPINNNHRDGAQQGYVPLNIAAYSDNTLNGGSPLPANQTEGRGFFSGPRRRLVDADYVRQVSPTFLDYWTQPRLFWNSLLPAEQQSLVDAARFELSKVTNEDVQKAAIAQFNRIDNGLATRVAAALGKEAPSPDSKYYHNNSTVGLSVFREPLPTAKGLKIGILASTLRKDSITKAVEIKKAFAAKGISATVIGETMAPNVDGVYVSNGAVLYDGIVLVDSAKQLLSTPMSTYYPPMRPFKIISEAYFFGKPVGVTGSDTGVLVSKGIAMKKSEPGVYASNDVNQLVNRMEEGLKTFKFVNRFPLDK